MTLRTLWCPRLRLQTLESHNTPNDLRFWRWGGRQEDFQILALTHVLGAPLYCGRNVQLPGWPRSDPGIRNYRTGLFRNTRFRKGFHAIMGSALVFLYCLGLPTIMWFLYTGLFNQFHEPDPIGTSPLAAPVQIFKFEPLLCID